MTVGTSAMNFIAHVHLIDTSAVLLVSASLPFFAVTVTLIAQMQVMKCIVTVSKECLLQTVSANKMRQQCKTSLKAPARLIMVGLAEFTL
jgi:hypothetical protein